MASQGEGERGGDDGRRTIAVTEQHRSLAAQAMAEYDRGSYSACASTMGRLAEQRATDVKVVLNRAVALFYQSSCRAVDEFRHNIQTVFNMAKISPDLSEKSNLDDADYAVVYYNKAVLLFHEKQYRAALSILEKLFKYIEPIDETLAQKMMLLLTELYLTVHQPYEAMSMIGNIEKFLSGKSQGGGGQDKDKADPATAQATEALKAKLMLYKVRCNLMAKMLSNKNEFKKLSGNSHPVNYAKAYHMYLRGNPKKAQKMLGNLPSVQLSTSSGECLAVMYANNQAVLSLSQKRPSLAICHMRDAIAYNEKVARDAVPNDKAKPALAVSHVSQHYTLLHNLGLLQLHSKKPVQAFHCFLECVQVFHRNPRLWLRLAECCIMHNKESNDSDRGHALRLEVVQGAVGAQHHHKLVLGQGTGGQTAKGSPGAGGVFPGLSLGFAMYCLHNGLALLPPDPQDAREPPEEPDTQDICPPVSRPVLVSAEPGNPLRETEVANLRCSLLAGLAYCSLAQHDCHQALLHATDLLRQPNLSPSQRYLGRMYQGEALVTLDRLADGIEALDPDTVTDVSPTLPQAPPDPEKDQEGLAECREPLLAWQPSTPLVGRALMQYNLAVAYAIRTDYQRAQKALTESSNNVGHPYPVQMFYLKLYLDLKQGNKRAAVSLINQEFGCSSKA